MNTTTYHATWTGPAMDDRGNFGTAKVTATFTINSGDGAELVRAWDVDSLEQVPEAAAGWALWYEAADIIRDQVAGGTAPFPVTSLEAARSVVPSAIDALHLAEATDNGETVQASGRRGDVTWTG